MMRKSKYSKYLVLALTIFVVSPIDDLVFASLFGTALFGFGSTEFYLLLIVTTAFSVILWKSRRKQTTMKPKTDTKTTCYQQQNSVLEVSFLRYYVPLQHLICQENGEGWKKKRLQAVAKCCAIIQSISITLGDDLTF